MNFLSCTERYPAILEAFLLLEGCTKRALDVCNAKGETVFDNITRDGEVLRLLSSTAKAALSKPAVEELSEEFRPCL